MSFANPLLLLGLLGATVPIIIHLIHKRRPRQQRFAAIELLLRSVQRVERRWRLRRFLLLAARVSLLAALSLAAAGPLLSKDSQATMSSSGPERLAIVIDASLSMRARYEGTTAFAKAQTKARNLVDAMGPEDQALIVVAQKIPQLPIARPTPDRAQLLRALGALEPSFEHASLSEAITKAAQALGSLAQDDKAKPPREGETKKISGRIVVLSDMAQVAIEAAADLRIPGSSQTAQLQLVDVLQGIEKRHNRAITRLEAVNVPGQAPRTVELRARIQSFMPERSGEPQPADITLRSKDQDLWAGSVDLVEGTIADKLIQHAFDQPGHIPVEVLLEQDILHEDDVRYISVDVRRQVRALIVDGAPSGVPKEDEIFYLERALSAGAADQPPPRVITADDLVRTDLSAFDVVILAGVAAFGRSEGARLVDFVKKGGGLMITASEDLDVELYNAELGPILPRPLRGLKITDVDLGSGGVVTLAKPAEHPVMSIFHGEALRGLLSTRTRGYLLLQPGGDRPLNVLVEHEDGQPALIEAPADKGRVVLLTTSIDRDLSDLPIRPAFLPLMRQLLLFLGNALSRPDVRRTLVGEPRQLQVPAGATRLVVTGPDGQETSWESSELKSGSVSFKNTRLPGHYQVEVAFAGPLEPLDRERFAVNVESRESDLRPMPLDEAFAVLQGAELKGGQKSAFSASLGGAMSGEKIASALLVLMLLAFFLESLLTAQKIGR